VILQSSRLEEWKGQAILIAALGRMKELPGWEAWIAGGVQKSGESDYLSALRRRVEELGISERVRFLGQRSDVRQLMAAADVYCQPNTGPEPFGLAFVEALQAGLPVVTSGFGGAAEIVDATCGILTRPADIAAVSTALVELIDNPVRRAELGLKGPGRAAELCDPPRQLERLAHALQGVSAFTGHGRQEALV
jgi:glycosyltransferase involved in cell wall biosynthesis